MTRKLSAAERMGLNAAMELLASGKEEGWWQAAQMVVTFGQTVSPTNVVFVGGHSPPHKKETVSGYSPGIGNVSIEEKTSSEDGDLKANQPVERIGRFKLMHNEASREVRFWDFRSEMMQKHDGPHTMIEFSIIYWQDGMAHSLVQPLWQERRSVWVTLMAYVRYLMLWWRQPSLKFEFIRIRTLHCVGLLVIHSIIPDMESGTILLKGGERINPRDT